MKRHAKIAVAVLAVPVLALTICAQDSKAPETAAQIHSEQSAPIENAAVFVSPKPGGETLAFFVTPDGSSAFVPVSEVQKAFEAGYRPVTFGDFLRAAQNDSKIMQDQQKRIDQLTGDYNALADRFNHLAASSQAPVPVRPSPAADDEKRAMRLMLFQSLLSRTAPTPPPTRIQVTDCTAYPSLCVH